MINASQEFKNFVKKGTKLVNYADITLKDGTVLNLGPSDFSVGGFSMTDKTSNGKFEIGTAIAKTISVTIANHTNKFSAYDFYKSIIYMYVAVEKEDGTVLKERKGKYYVINPTSPGDTIKLSGVDSMYLFDKPYNPKTFPATLQTILADCCIDCGVNIGFGEFDNWNFEVMNAPEECTYRQVVSWVAQIAGCHARINNNDYLELVWYDTSSLEKVNIDGGNYFVYENENIIDGGDFTTYESDLIIDGGNFTDYAPPNVTKIKPPTVSTDNVVITGVKVEHDKKEVLLGTDDYLINVKDNPFVKDKENEVCQYLADRLIGLSFRPLSCQMVNNPLFEPFDSCYVYDRKGNVYFTLINSVTYTISGFTTLSCNADDPVRNESSYVSESAKAIVQARRNTEKQLTTYDKAVQNMNMLAANSMGLYRESETQSDGSVIYYMSNRPITKDDNGICSFEENSVVYKMTGSGFFVSEDGGLSYTSGFDSEGNAVVNVLSAIGITFDWARGGTLSLGGYDNLNGVIKIYDRNGVNTGVIDNNGIALYAENGVQIILSPLTGLVQRDAEGNEFYGLIYDEIVGGFPRYNQKKYSLYYDGIDSDKLNTSYQTKEEDYDINDYLSSTRHYKKFTHSYTHEYAQFVPRIGSVLSGYKEVTYQLPTVFKGKSWVIRVEQSPFDFTGIENSGMYYYFYYNTTLPKCYEGSPITGEWLPWYDVMDSSFGVGASGNLTKDNSVIQQLISNGVETPYLKLPSVTSGNVAINYTASEMKNVENQITTDFEWSYDETNATVTIKAKAEWNNINLNEFMRFRIYVVC